MDGVIDMSRLNMKNVKVNKGNTNPEDIVRGQESYGRTDTAPKYDDRISVAVTKDMTRKMAIICAVKGVKSSEVLRSFVVQYIEDNADLLPKQ